MSAAKAVMTARAAGIQLGVDGNDLVLEATTAPLSEMLDLLRIHKAEILAFLRLGHDGCPGRGRQAFFAECLGKAEFAGVLSRLELEKRAFEWCVIEWLNQHCEPSDPAQCAWCKQPDQPTHVVVPFGTNLHGHTWLHPECWREWHKLRRETATQALLAKEIHGPYVELREPEVQMPRADSEMAAAGDFTARGLSHINVGQFPVSAPPWLQRLRNKAVETAQ